MSEAGEQGWFGSEQLVLCRDDEIGLRAVIAIDDTTLSDEVLEQTRARIQAALGPASAR